MIENNENIEIYKTYVETIENISKRRLSIHTFFLTLNLAFLSVLAILLTRETVSNIGKIILCISTIVGAILNICYLVFLVRYKQINKIKYDILVDIESSFNFQPFVNEKKLFKKNKMKSLSILSYLIPSIFLVCFIVILILLFVYII